MAEYKNILLLKVPYCQFPDKFAFEEDTNFRTKQPFRPVPSLAIASLGAFFDKYNKYGYTMKAVDINIEAYKEPGVPIDTSIYPQLIEETIKSTDYNVLMLSVQFVFNLKWADLAIKLSRQYHPQAKIIMGGGYPTLFPERCLNLHDVDDIIIGEGEVDFFHIVNGYNNIEDPEFLEKFPNHDGYGTRIDKDTIKVFPRRKSFLPAEEFLAPAWNYLDLDRFFKNSGDTTLPMEGSRGCPYLCTYCSTHLSWGRSMRYKDIDKLIQEMKDIRARYKDVELLHFVDDNLSFSKKWFKEFLTKLIASGMKGRMNASNFSVLHLDEELIDLMKEAGMIRVAIAVESGSDEMQKFINKRLNFDKVKRTIDMVKAKGLETHICWMVGFPGETLAQINDTFNFARELKSYSNQFLTVLPYPGTKLFEQAKEMDLLHYQEDELDKFDNKKCDYVKSDEWNHKLLQEMIYDVNIDINFLNNDRFGTPEGEERMLEFVAELVKRLPQHVIAHIIAGYLYKKKGDRSKQEEHYKQACEHLENDQIHDTFNKYLSWDHPIIKDFNQYAAAQAIMI